MYAQEPSDSGVSLGVSPAIIEVALRPGDSITRELTLSSQAEPAIPISGKVESLIDTDEVINLQIRKQFDASTWVSLPNESVVLPANETKKYRVDISVPKNATPGGHYAQVTLQALSLEKANLEGAGRSIVIPEISVSVFITVAGNINENLNVLSGNLFPYMTSPDSENYLSFQVANRGNVHALIVPKVIISKNGKDIESKSLTPKVVLPNSIKQFTETWVAPEANGLYDARVVFTYGNQQKDVSTAAEKLAIIPSLWKLFVIAMFTYLARYIFIHRKNVKAAYETLIAK